MLTSTHWVKRELGWRCGNMEDMKEGIKSREEGLKEEPGRKTE